jgi:UDP-N-acetylglucosamine 2-epimerase (non-hydrolysing)
MKKYKICTVVGTRPEIIRLSMIIKKFEKEFSHTLIHTGQNFDKDLSEIFFKDLNLKSPKYQINSFAGNSIATIAKAMIEVDKILEKIKPDAFFILGDTNSALTTICAKKRKIPIFHYEAGNRSFDQRVPEETNRKIVDSISDINLTYSHLSKLNLINEGFQSDKVINVGSPMFEVLNFYKQKISDSSIMKKLNIKNKNFYLVSAHREENIESNDRLKNILNIIEHLSVNHNLPIIVSTHPRLRKKLKGYSKKNIILHKPFSFTDYVNLQKNSKIVISDSGTINEEASILGFNAINLREAHERPEANEEAVTIMTGTNLRNVINAIKYFENNPLTNNKKEIIASYSKENVSDTIVKIIISFINYIKQNNYKKNIN